MLLRWFYHAVKRLAYELAEVHPCQSYAILCLTYLQFGIRLLHCHFHFVVTACHAVFYGTLHLFVYLVKQ